jgi:hypothetical protein
MSDQPATMSRSVSPLSVTLSLLPAAERDLLRYLAPLTSFDDEIAGEVAAPLWAGRGGHAGGPDPVSVRPQSPGPARPVPNP